jgi:NodT family efflux transporter outer membrane factor (OMF) lipoprotein
MHVPRSRFALFAATGLVVFSAGCTSSRPAQPSALPAITPGNGTPDGPPRQALAWWTSFASPDIDALVDQALRDNLSLRAAWDRLAQADAVARRAGAERRPAVDLSLGAARTRRDSPTSTDPVYTTTYEASLGASYEIDLWGRVRAARDAAALEAEATAEQIQTAALTLAAEVTLASFERAELDQRIRLLRDQIATNQRIRDALDLRFRRGLSQAADVLQQDQLIESQRGTLAAAEGEAAVAAHRLNLLIGHPPSHRLPPPSPLPVPTALPEASLSADLLARRPDLRAALLRVLAADHRLDAARADRLPRLSLSARVGAESDALDTLFDDWIASLAGNLLAPLIDGGARAAEVDRVRAALSEALNTYAATALQAFVEAENALVQERRQAEQLTSLRRQLDLARDTAERIRDSYLNGGEDFLRVLTAQTSLQSLERQVLLAQRQQLAFRVALYRALAGPVPLETPEPATLPPAPLF